LRRSLTTCFQAGEDLEEIEEDDEEAAQDREDLMPATLTDAEASLGASITFNRDLAKPINYDERTPLISSSSVIKDRSRSRQRRKRAGSVGPHGDATVVQAVLMVGHN
jgi:proton-coupled amino acid transporter